MPLTKQKLITMNTNNDNSAGVKPAFNEADVTAWLHDLVTASGISGLQLSIGTAGYASGDCYAYAQGVGSALGTTFADAIAQVRKQIKPIAEVIAEKDRQIICLQNERALLELQAINEAAAKPATSNA